MRKNHDISLIKKRFFEIEKNIEKLQEIEAELNTLETEGLESYELAIRRNLKNPTKLDEVEYDFSQLKDMIAKREEYRKTIPGISDLGRQLAQKATKFLKDGRFDESLQAYRQALERIVLAHGKSAEQNDEFRREMLAEILADIHLGILNARISKAAKAAQEAVGHFKEVEYQKAKTNFLNAVDEMVKADAEYRRVKKNYQLDERAKKIFERIEKETSVIKKNIESCEIALDREKVKELFGKADSKFKEAKEKGEDGLYERAISLLMETENYFHDAFLIARKRPFAEDIASLEGLLKNVDKDKEIYRRKLRDIGDIPPAGDSTTEEVESPAGKIIETPEEELFDFRKELGRGAWGIVYLAFNKLLKRNVAVKVLFDEFARDKNLVDRFLREAQIAAQLDRHPHIVRIYSVGTIVTRERLRRPYIEMSYIEGSKDLRTILADRKRLDFQTVITISSQICDALAYAHKKGILHKDIKPSNILMSFGADFADSKPFFDRTTISPHVSVTDFGIAGAKDEPRRIRTAFTPAYASLEQIEGVVLDERTDIYSLGVTMYEMLTGEVPLKGDPVPPREAVKEIPPFLNDVILKCLDRNRSRRYQSAIDLRKALLLQQSDLRDFDSVKTRTD